MPHNCRCEIIELWPIVAECHVCGDPSYKTGIPMYEDLVLPNDWEGEWGGQPACFRCMLRQGDLVEPMTLHEFRVRFTTEWPTAASTG